MLSVIETPASKIVFCLKFAKLAQSWIILYFMRLVVRRQRSVNHRSVSDSRHYRLPAFSWWSYRSKKSDCRRYFSKSYCKRRQRTSLTSYK